MKKILAMLLSVTLLMTGFALTVSADDIFNDTELDWGDGIFNDTELDWSAYIGNVTIGSVEGAVGEQVVVPVTITKNPGIVSIKLSVNYDKAALELVAATAGDFGSTEGSVPTLSFGPLDEDAFIINWADALATENNETTGVLANLTFLVKEGATGAIPVQATCDAEDVFDVDLNNVEFVIVAGSVTVDDQQHLPGDVNGDGSVNIFDLGILQRYINGWDVEINEAAANVNGDAAVNIFDLGILQRYINGWDVELK